jgi:large subunit ribosomal protein L4
MTIDVYTATGTKKGTMSLPASLFEAPVRRALMHQAVVMQQSNRRKPIAHAKDRGEVQGSTKKLYGQKHTGRARRGPVRSPLLRGGGKAFGPRKNRNFTKDMPRSMRHAALRSALSLQAKHATIVALEEYPTTIKTKAAATLIQKLPLKGGRSTLFVLPEKHNALQTSVRNIPGIRTVLANYLNPEEVLWARNLVFLHGAVEIAEKIFGNAGMTEKSKTIKKSKTNTTKSSTTEKTSSSSS